MKKIFLFLTVIIFVSCNKNTVFSEFIQISEKGWSVDSSYRFTFDIIDSISLYEIDLMIRNANNFPRQNLWLELKREHNDNITTDSVNICLLDDNGKWIGSSAGSYYDGEYIYKRGMRLSTGRYTYIIRHIMRFDCLPGIKNLGMRVVRKDKYGR
ncbi:MAG: gliding motility lipoprotein GldH [Prevotellaceae bacterium]|jgi:gliding motility-associated lipoprotein GldH|nr:gliding motility lipoprotein GldH [Prevotellaceae bacterium]